MDQKNQVLISILSYLQAVYINVQQYLTGSECHLHSLVEYHKAFTKAKKALAQSTMYQCRRKS